MVEILVLGRFAERMGAMAQEKGLPARKYHLMAILLWCLCEMVGLFAGLLVSPLTSAAALLLIYTCALLGGCLGAMLTYLIVRGIKPEYAPLGRALRS